MPLKPPPSVEDFLKSRKPYRDLNKEIKKRLSRLDKIALWITDHVGTMGFFLTIFTWTALWLAWNTLAPQDLRFDPAPAFACWLFISNLIQIMLMPLIMIGQNIQSRRYEERAKNDLDINTKAEQEIEIILRHLEYQNNLLLTLQKKQAN